METKIPFEVQHRPPARATETLLQHRLPARNAARTQVTVMMMLQSQQNCRNGVAHRALLTLGEWSANETGTERNFAAFLPFFVPEIGGGFW